MWTFGKKLDLPTADEALRGRDEELPVAGTHTVLGTPLKGPWPEGTEVAYFGMGCFWGAERFFWKLPGVHSTSRPRRLTWWVEGETVRSPTRRSGRAAKAATRCRRSSERTRAISSRGL